MKLSCLLVCASLSLAASSFALDNHAFDQEGLPDLSGGWKARIGFFDVVYVVEQSGPFVIWRAEGIDESAFGRIENRDSENGTLNAEWQGPLGSGKGAAKLVREAGLVVRLEWDHGIVFGRTTDASPPPKPGDAEPKPADLAGEWKASFGPIETTYVVRQAAPFFVWHNDALRESGGGRQVLRGQTYESVSAEWSGTVAGSGSGSATFQRGAQNAVEAISWDNGVRFERASGLKPAAAAAGKTEIPLWLPPGAHPADGKPTGGLTPVPVVKLPQGSNADKPTGGLTPVPVVKLPTGPKPQPSSGGEMPLRNAPHASAEVVFAGQVLQLQHSVFTAIIPAPGPPDVPAVQHDLPDYGDDGAQARFVWWEASDELPGQSANFSTAINDLPQGIVFGLREIHLQADFPVRVGADSLSQNDVDGESTCNSALAQPWPGRAYSIWIGHLAPGNAHHLSWLESNGNGSPQSFALVKRLPKGTVACLKHSGTQSGKVLVWNGRVYDPVKNSLPPEGFVRRYGGDLGAEGGHGLFWYEKVTDPGP